MKIVLVPLFAYLTALSLTSEVNWMSRAHARGLGYASKSWHDTELITLIDSLPQGIPIYSNAPDAISVLTKRPAYMLPAKATRPSMARSSAACGSCSKRPSSATRR